MGQGGWVQGAKELGKFRGGEEVRRARVLAWTLKCVTASCDTDDSGDQH